MFKNGLERGSSLVCEAVPLAVKKSLHTLAPLWEDFHEKWCQIFSPFHPDFFWRKYERNKTSSKMIRRDQVVIFESRIWCWHGWIFISRYACGTGRRESILWLAFTPSLQFLFPGLALTHVPHMVHSSSLCSGYWRMSCVPCLLASARFLMEKWKCSLRNLAQRVTAVPGPERQPPCVFW